LAQVIRGNGNGDGSATEGAIDGRVVGTYLHGPVLSRNPALADLLLVWALQVDGLPPLDDGAHEALRLERLAAAGVGPSSGRPMRRRTLRRGT
jgi:lipid II isoglutaminyl synthase (glutamine-hydrolysing)